MGNAKNKKVPKKRKSKHSSLNTSTTSSAQKENRPKNKVLKVDPNDTISMSKQLLQKRSNSRAKRRSTSHNGSRLCLNGKPLPSLADLEKMFEDSDGDEESSHSSKTGTQALETCSTPTPEKQKPSGISEDKLLSPTTINKISERMMDLITNITNPIELLEDVPPPPVVPPKKRKKTEVPYIVGCKDRPKVPSKPSTNFCKGDEDYGVEASCGDLDDSPPTKRAKKSKIPNYLKSIFNAKTDEIVDRLTKDDAGATSDGSSDSNKTIEYDPAPFKRYQPHTFSPLPSTSKDNETFIKNDELFNESLREIADTKVTIPKEKENEVQIIDIPYDTIVVEDVSHIEKPVEIHNTNNITDTNDFDTNDIEIIEPTKKEDHNVVIDTNHIDDDCIFVKSSTENNNQDTPNQPIVIDDEYGDINLIDDTEPIEIIDLDVDDVIAQNKSILNKLKKYGTDKIDKINAVVDVPSTYRNTTASQPIASSTPQKTSTLHDSNKGNTQKIQDLYYRNIVLNGNTNTLNLNRECGNPIEQVVTNFFDRNKNLPRSVEPRHSNTHVGLFQPFIDAILNFTVRKSVPPIAVTSVMNLHANNEHTLHNLDVRTRDRNVNIGNQSVCNMTNPTIDASRPSSIHGKQKTNDSPTYRADTPEKPRNLGDCPICMDQFSSDGIASTICGHVFCLKCIQASIKANGKRCPTCRKVLKGAGGGYHQLYL